MSMATVCIEIYEERVRQIQQEGWTSEHEDEHTSRELARAASCYALHAGTDLEGEIPMAWPWDSIWWKPTTQRRDLIKAAALITAEIERLDRADGKS